MEYLYSRFYQFKKLFQDCKAEAEELFREDVVNELQRGKKTPRSSVVVPEVLEVHVVPSDEVRMTPE